MSNITWKKTRTETVLKDRWIDFKRRYYIMPNGEEIGPFYTYSKRDYVVIVATDENGNYICVNQYRQGIDELTTEFTAGGVEVFDSATENTEVYGNVPEEQAFQTAVRELREETGYASDDWEFLMTLPSHATINNDYAHIYRARNCKKVGGQELDSTEFINVRIITPEELAGLVKAGDFKQAMHVLAWYASRERDAVKSV